jgi:hypothetical protein
VPHEQEAQELAVPPNLGASSFVTGERGAYRSQPDDFMVAVVTGVTTSAGWYASINDVMGLAYNGWLISVGISMMRVKPKAAVRALHERELKEAG